MARAKSSPPQPPARGAEDGAAAASEPPSVKVLTLERGVLKDCPICYEKLGVIPVTDESNFVDDDRSAAANDDDDDDAERHGTAGRSASASTSTAKVVDGCRHMFCRECLVQHCQESVRTRRHPIFCPQHGCSVTLTESLVEEMLVASRATATDSTDLSSPRDDGNIKNDDQSYGHICSSTTPVSTSLTVPYGGDDLKSAGVNADIQPPAPDYWRQYQRIRRFSQDPSLVPCTKCHEPVAEPQESENEDGHDDVDSEAQSRGNRKGNDSNYRVCSACGHRFCAVHGDAHAGQSCQDYQASARARQVQLSEDAIQGFAKPCSHCGAYLHKTQGCDHIVCLSCHEDMCFRCGTHEHLTGEMLRSCRQCDQHFIDHRHIWVYRMTLLLTLPCFLPAFLLHVVVAGLISIVTFGCCCCFGCGYSAENAEKREEALVSEQKRDLPRVFDPLFGVRMVLCYVFWPFIDLIQQCGCSCFCGLITPKELLDERRAKDEAQQTIDNSNTIISRD